jgi:hypothetical protein
MRRFLMTFSASALAFVVVLGLTALAIGIFGPRLAAAQGFGPGFGGPLGGPWSANLPAEIQSLHNLAPEQRFGHFMGGSMGFTDVNDQAHSVALVPGTVASFADGKLTIEPNDKSGTRSYTIGSETRVHVIGQRWAAGQAGEATPKQGDNVMVVDFDGSETARAVMIGGPNGFGPGHGPGFGPGRRG